MSPTDSVMPYHGWCSHRETAQLDGSVNQGDAGDCPEFRGDAELLYYNPHHFRETPNTFGSPLAQHQVPFKTTSTLTSACDNVPSNSNWYDVVGSCFTQSPLTPESDQTIDDSMLKYIFNWSDSAATFAGSQNGGYLYPLSPARSTEELSSQTISASPPSTRGPNRSRRILQCNKCEKLFTKNNDLRRHFESIHSTHGPKYRCICGHARPRKDNHKRHVSSCNNTPKHPSYKCKCTAEHVDRQTHLSHVRECRAAFYGCAGRPRGGTML
ncbi:hypothetical protein F4806DRAFT_506538 [Annulohypoxylon nitens]|nr:hypothetical protein F4806DRAFT_506538 [Annulohypoxylon nitens]